MDKPAQWALVGAAWFLALAVGVFGFLCWQRLGHVHPTAAPVAEAALSASNPVVQTAICPVTGERVVVGSDTPQVTYQGRVYYFSTDRDAQGNDARTRFLMNPDSWIKGSGRDAP